jgi:hypothetical protein
MTHVKTNFGRGFKRMNADQRLSAKIRGFDRFFGTLTGCGSLMWASAYVE